ncbi:IclR family transcriptional regulator [Brevibacterium casei]|nr:IclR family transcriptional regulator [Brevibacterium casei]QPR39960.1 IclR family transcriptional regulator [Brevibacterium casei]QPR44124.1 IclR family transcriptional regulator [Brevibacterium casei]QPS32328.1 IclR family transcriptional regulator [Brevibacterium casei]
MTTTPQTDRAGDNDDIPRGTQTLDRGLDIVAAVASGASSLKEVVTATSIGRSSAHRMIQLLTQRGYLRLGSDQELLLGPTLIEFGFTALNQNPLPVVARESLERLSAKTQDTIHLSIEDGGSVLYLHKIPGTRGAEMRSRIGHRMPMTRTGVGKALLLGQDSRWESIYRAENPGTDDAAVAAFIGRMERYTRDGASFDMEENEPGIRCVAAPVRDGSGSIVAGVSLSATRPFMPQSRMRALVPVMKATAHEISVNLGYSGPSTQLRSDH